MSPWWRDQVRVYLAPDRIVAARLSGGLRHRILGLHEQSFPATPDHGALFAALAAMLARPEWRKADATVLLSSRLVHYELLPWTDAGLDAAEESARARQACARVLGDAGAAALDLRACVRGFGHATVVSGVDKLLLARVRETLAAASVKLVSVQPYLMAAFNQCRPGFARAPQWLAVVESGTLCTALLDRGRFVSLRSRRIAGDWVGELQLALRRQSVAHEGSQDAARLLVHAAEHEEPQWPLAEGWSVRQWPRFELPQPGYGLALAGVA